MSRIVSLSAGGWIHINCVESCPNCDAGPVTVESKIPDDTDPEEHYWEDGYYVCTKCTERWSMRVGDSDRANTKDL